MTRADSSLKTLQHEINICLLVVVSLFVTLSTCTHMIWGETNMTYKHIIEPGCFGYRMIIRKKVSNYKVFCYLSIKKNKRKKTR